MDPAGASIDEVRSRLKTKKRVKATPVASLAGHSKSKLAGAIVEVDAEYLARLKMAIIGQARVDILATHVLGYECTPLHSSLLAFQAAHDESLQLVFRGAGKTTVLSVAKSIWYMCVNPDLRVLICSKTFGMAADILKEVKHHLEHNQILQQMFGQFAPSSMNDPTVVWNEKEINILQRKKITKESSITAVGAEGAVVGKHYDIQLIDDLVDEDNSRTPGQRERIRKFYYKTLDPCLEPPDPDVPHRGERHIIGTRYHPDDHYGHLKKNELKDSAQVIPALTVVGHDPKNGRAIYTTPWPEKFSVDFFIKKREVQGAAIFDSQYQCDVEAMRGEVFRPEWFDHDDIYYDKLPDGAIIWSAADLAISPKSSADKFAHVTIAKHGDTFYLIDYVWGRFGFSQQTCIIGERFLDQDPIRTGIEAVAYQAAQIQRVREEYPEIPRNRIIPIHTKLDKMTRAWKLTAIFEAHQVRVKRGHQDFVRHMIAFRDGSEMDLFDAFEMACSLAMRGAKKRRAVEPGVL